jgi:hypothetical protein
MDETDLAWALAQVADPYLDPVERHDIYIAIGVGETFQAITASIAAIARARLALGSDLVVAFKNWLNAYRGHDGEPRLHQLIDAVQLDQAPDRVPLLARHS